MPYLRRWLRKIRRRLRLVGKSREQIFAEDYEKYKVQDKHALRAPGLALERSAAIRKALPGILRNRDCRCMLDIPCGDFSWMRSVDLDVPYIGADIISDMVTSLQERYGNTNRSFVKLDLVEGPVPRVDLVFCRACLTHLSHGDVARAIRNIKASQSTFLLTTTYPNRKLNKNARTGEWHTINLQKPPFGFPQPLELIDETLPHPGYSDQHMGLWRISELPDL